MPKTRRANRLTGLIRFLGFRKDNFSRSALPYLIFTFLICAVSLYLLNKTGGGNRALLIWKSVFHVLWYVPVFAAAEELLLRGIIMPVLVTRFLKMLKIILIDSVINGAAYLLLAILMPLPGDMKNSAIAWSFPAGFISGLLFSSMYYNYPNIYTVIVSRLIILCIIPAACFLKIAGCA